MAHLLARDGGLWRQRDFRLLVAAQTITQFGSDVSAVVFPLVALLILEASALQLGIVVAIQTSGFLLVGLPVGAWLDRVPRRPVLVGSDLLRAVAVATIPLAAVVDQLTMAQLYLVAAITSIGKVLYDVGYQSYLPSLVARSELVEGNAKLEAVRAAAQVGGPGLGGWLAHLVGASTALLADALSYLGSAACLAAIR